MAQLNNGFPADVVVQKYGGSSLATTEKIRAVAERVESAHRSGQSIVVVVSAQGETTNNLLRLAAEFNPAPSGRELDQLLATGETSSAALLAMALQNQGVPAAALTGPQSGILATGPHGAGIIVAVDTERVVRLLRTGHVVVVAGFQGMTADSDVITLGRGGSDTTAVAIAAELRTGWCEIYTDVHGVYTADPRIAPSARVMPEVNISVMTEMAFAGAKVVHSRAAELAALYGVDIHVKHSLVNSPGTIIRSENGGEMLESRVAVVAVVHDLNAARVTMRFHGIQGDSATDVFRFLAEKSVAVDMATLSDGTEDGFSVGMTVRRNELGPVRRSLETMAELRSGAIEVDDTVGKLSVVGTGLLSRPAYAARMLTALTEAAIPASSMAVSQFRISVTVPASEVVRAVGVLQSEFGLDSTENRVAVTHQS
jgi:aspartate kinase